MSKKKQKRGAPAKRVYVLYNERGWYNVDEDWYIGRLREIPSIFSQGETLQELEDNIRDAYKIMFEDAMENLPLDSNIQTKEIGVEV